MYKWREKEREQEIEGCEITVYSRRARAEGLTINYLEMKYCAYDSKNTNDNELVQPRCVFWNNNSGNWYLRRVNNQ